VNIISSIGPTTLGLLLGGVLLLLLAGWWLLRSGAGHIDKRFRAVAVDTLVDVVVPNGMGGEIHLDHVLLTARGLVVLDIKVVRGIVFASDRMDDWTVMAKDRRFTFANPQPALYDRVAAVRSVVPDVPVAGHVLFDAQADFSKGVPKEVIQPLEFLELYKKPPKDELRTLVAAFRPHWERLREESVPLRGGA
jgi:hypothetical protein